MLQVFMLIIHERGESVRRLTPFLNSRHLLMLARLILLGWSFARLRLNSGESQAAPDSTTLAWWRMLLRVTSHLAQVERRARRHEHVQWIGHRVAVSQCLHLLCALRQVRTWPLVHPGWHAGTWVNSFPLRPVWLIGAVWPEIAAATSAFAASFLLALAFAFLGAFGWGRGAVTSEVLW